MASTVAIYDPQFITRQGLEGLMHRLDQFDKVDATQTPEDLDALLAESRPNMLVIDYLPGATFRAGDFVKIKKQYPELKTLIISDDNDKARIQAVIKSGIRGFLTKSCSEKEVLEAIDTIRDGGKFFCKKILEIITSGEEYTYSELSEREIEIVKLISKGLSSAQIANDLIISVHTVNSHRKNILKKLGLKSPTELIIYAAERGWVGLG